MADLFQNRKICIGPFKDASRSSHAWRQREMGCLDNHCRSLGSGYDIAHVTLELEAFWVGFELELKGTYSYCWVVDAEGRRYHPF